VKGILFFQAILPIAVAIVYCVAIQYGMNPIPYITYTFGFAVIAVVLIEISTALASLFIFGFNNRFINRVSIISPVLFVAASAVFAVLVTFPVWLPIWFFVIAAVLFAMGTASEMQKELHSKSELALLIACNILYTGAIGSAVFFGMTLDGVSMFAAAVILPIMMFFYESELHKEHVNV